MMDALLHSNRVPEPHEAKIISSMINTERESINALDTGIHQLEQDADMARQRIQKLTTQLEVETRGLRFYEDAIAELQTTRNVLRQSIERKQAIVSSRRRTPGEIWRTIFLLLWENAVQELSWDEPIFPVALRVGAVCQEWRDLAQTTTRLWSILDYTFSPDKRVESRRENEMDHYLVHIGAVTPDIILRKASALRLPSVLCKVTNAASLVVLLEHQDLINRPQLTFPPSTPIFSQLDNIHIYSLQHIIQIKSDFLRPFPSLVNLRLTNAGIHWLQPIIPHLGLKFLSIGGPSEGSHFWKHVTNNIAVIAECFSNLTVLILDGDWQIVQQTSTAQVILRHVKRLSMRSSAITDVHGLTSRVSLPSLNMITNHGKNMNGLAPIVEAWGERVETLELAWLGPYDGLSQHLSEILGDSGKLPQLSKLAFSNITQIRAIDLSLVVDAVIRHNDSVSNDQDELNCIKTVILPSFYNSDPNLNRWRVAVEWSGNNMMYSLCSLWVDCTLTVVC